jgi:glucosamine--fructose-6-phosphate aminotransferase (isomerizing)
MTTLYETELREQPEVLSRLLGSARERCEAIAAAIRGYGPRYALIAARGSSDNAARYGQYLLGIQNGLVAALATPSVFTHYRATPSLAGALAIGISQSGQSPDIVTVIREARRQGAATLAITNAPDSPLAAAAEHVFPLLAGEERAVAATKTYGAQLMALAMLSTALRDGAWSELAALPEQVARTLEANARCAEQAKRFAGNDRLIVLGRGYNFSTALEVTLKIKETSGIMADGYSSADFLHGPKALADRALPVLSIGPARGFDDLDAAVAFA